MHLGHFQDGISDVALDCNIPAVRANTDSVSDPEFLNGNYVL